MKEKTIEDVRLHCLDNGYTKEAMNQICAYLCGRGIKGRKEIIKFLVGDGTYEDFLEWFENDEVAIFVGDYIHAKDGGNYQIINLGDKKIVVIDGDAKVKVIAYDDVVRPCTDEEEDDLYDLLEANGLFFCPECEALEATSDLDPILGKIEALEEANPEDEDIAGVVEKLRNLCTWLDILETNKENEQRIVSILEDLAMYMNNNEE